MAVIVLALGLVLIVEGLAYALAPSLIERLLEMLRALPLDQRRNAGMVALALGVALVWLAHLMGVDLGG